MTPTPTGECERILAALTHEPQTAPQLARAARVNPCSIYQHLWWLSSQRLVCHVERPATRRNEARFFWLLPAPVSEPARPSYPALTKAQLDARLELLKARHAALIAQGRIHRRGDADRRSTVDPDRVRRHRPAGDVGGVEEGACRREDAACVPTKPPNARPSGAGRG